MEQDLQALLKTELPQTPDSRRKQHSQSLPRGQ